MFIQGSRFIYRLACNCLGVQLLISCGNMESAQMPALDLTNKNPFQNSADEPGRLELTRQDKNPNSKSNKWLLSKDAANSFRPENFDKAFSSYVKVVDEKSGKICSGVRVAEDSEIYVVTAAHCFVANDQIGRRTADLDKGSTFQVQSYSPAPIVDSKHKVNLSLYVPNKTLEKIKNTDAWEHGSGDALRFLVKSNASAQEINNTTMPLCGPSDDEYFWSRSLVPYSVMLGETEEVFSGGSKTRFLVPSNPEKVQSVCFRVREGIFEQCALASGSRPEQKKTLSFWKINQTMKHSRPCSRKSNFFRNKVLFSENQDLSGRCQSAYQPAAKIAQTKGLQGGTSEQPSMALNC